MRDACLKSVKRSVTHAWVTKDEIVSGARWKPAITSGRRDTRDARGCAERVIPDDPTKPPSMKQQSAVEVRAIKRKLVLSIGNGAWIARDQSVEPHCSAEMV